MNPLANLGEPPGEGRGNWNNSWVHRHWQHHFWGALSTMEHCWEAPYWRTLSHPLLLQGYMPSWQINGNGNSDRLYIFWGSKITADGDCSHEIKRCLLHGRKSMTNLDSILKSIDITFLAKIHVVKAMVLPVVMFFQDVRVRP